jgi:hypothetical protein
MAIGGFNGTDPAPTLQEFRRYVAGKQIHYFIRGGMMIGSPSSGSREAAHIAEWVEAHYVSVSIDNVIVYDLTQPPQNS